MTAEKKPFYIIYLFLLLFAIVVSYVSYHNYSDQKELYSKQFKQNQLVLVKQVAAIVEELLQSEKHKLEIFAESESLYGDSDLEKLRDILSFYTLMRNEITSLRVFDKAGKLMYALPSETYRGKIGSYYMDSVALEYVSSKKKLYISDSKVDHTTEYAVTMTAPMFGNVMGRSRSRSARFLGAVEITLKLKKIEALIFDSIDIDDGSYIWCMSNSGKIIFHSNDSVMLDWNSQSEFYGGQYKGLGRVFEAMRKQGSGNAILGDIANENYVAYTPITLNVDNFWSIAVATPVEVIQRVNAVALKQNVIFALILVALFIISNLIIKRAMEKYTALKLDQKKREVSKKYLELIENTSNIVFTVTKDKYEIISCNKVFYELLDIAPGKLVDISFLDLLDSQGQKLFVDNFKKAVAGIPTTYQLDIKNEKWAWAKQFVMKNTSAISNKDSEDVHCIGTDISAQSNLADELKKMQNKLQTVFDNMQFGASLISKDFDVIMVNRYQAKLLNKKTDDFPGHKCYELFRANNNICSDCPAIKTLQNATLNKSEMTVSFSSGKKKCYNLYTAPLLDAEQNVYGFISSVRDITEIKHLEKKMMVKDKELKIINNIFSSLSTQDDLWLALREVLAKLLVTFEHSSGLVLLIDVENKKLSIAAKMNVSDSFANQVVEMWGNEELVSDMIRDKKSILLEDIYGEPKISIDFKALLQAKATKQLTLIPILNKGRVVGSIALFGTAAKTLEEYSGSWLFDAIGREVGIVVENHQLNKKISESVKDLKEAQVAIAEKERLQMVNDLAGAAAHDLNQPLTTIISYSELLMNDVPEDSNTYQGLKVVFEE